MNNTLRNTQLSIALLLGAALAACSDATTEPIVEPPPLRVAITGFEGTRPFLLAGDASGINRTRLHFSDVTDLIPNNDPGLVVSDEHLLALGAPSISPNCWLIAVVATLAYDQSEIVVMKRNGSGGEVASINTQIIGSSPEWSEDGTKLAYTMSTKPNFGGLDLFMTNLATHAVTRLTTDERLDLATIRWSTDATAIYYTRRGVSTASMPGERVNELVRITVATGAEQVVATGITGTTVGISRDGTRVLLMRQVATPGGGSSQALIESRIGGSERTLVESGVVSAKYSRDEGHAVVVTAAQTGNDVVRQYMVMELASKTTARISNVAGEANVDACRDFAPD